MMCDKCNNFVCKFYKGTCFKYRIKKFFKNLLTNQKKCGIIYTTTKKEVKYNEDYNQKRDGN